jgi:hypothetical protein
MTYRKQWCIELLDVITEEANRRGLDIEPSWHEDGEPEVFVTWANCKTAHCRISFGEEDDGKRWGFYTLAIQGCGGVQFLFDPVNAPISEMMYAIQSYRFMIDAFKRRPVEL